MCPLVITRCIGIRVMYNRGTGREIGPQPDRRHPAMKIINACAAGAVVCAPAHVCPDSGADYTVVSDTTRAHEARADLDTPRTRAAVIWRIEHRDDYANTVF